MRRSHHAIVSMSIILAAAMLATAHAQTAAPYDELAKTEAAANAEKGKRVAPLNQSAIPRMMSAPTCRR